MFAKGSQLAQVRPSASASTAYTATLRTEVTQIVVCNTSGSPAQFSIYHDDDGATYDATTSLFWLAAIDANTTVTIISEAIGSGFAVKRGGAIGVKPSVDQALTFTVYGVTEEIGGNVNR
jgi:hypothetical protein